MCFCIYRPEAVETMDETCPHPPIVKSEARITGIQAVPCCKFEARVYVVLSESGVALLAFVFCCVKDSNFNLLILQSLQTYIFFSVSFFWP